MTQEYLNELLAQPITEPTLPKEGDPIYEYTEDELYQIELQLELLEDHYLSEEE